MIARLEVECSEYDKSIHIFLLPFNRFPFMIIYKFYKGALHTRLGCVESRDESEGMKMAVAHFQCAAWAFHSLPDMFPQVSVSKSQSTQV